MIKNKILNIYIIYLIYSPPDTVKTSHVIKEFNSDPKKRPTVNRILRDSYIKKNIMLFLERTKKM
jgi:hypothetical protein